MDIWLTWCRRVAKCRFCSKPITARSPIVKGKWWRKSDGTAARWCFRSYWHPECWLKEGLTNLELHPYRAKSQGRPRMELDSETRTLRLKLLQSRARTMQLLRERLVNGCSWEQPLVQGLVRKLIELAEKMEAAGGLPESWGKPLIEILGVGSIENESRESEEEVSLD